jgi:hypothetical protein
MRRDRVLALAAVGGLFALFALYATFGFPPYPETYPRAAFDVTIPSASDARFRSEIKTFASRRRFHHTQMGLPPPMDDPTRGGGTAIDLIRHDHLVSVSTGFRPDTYDVAVYKSRGPLAASDEEVRTTAAKLEQAMSRVPGAVVVRRAPSAP